MNDNNFLIIGFGRRFERTELSQRLQFGINMLIFFWYKYFDDFNEIITSNRVWWSVVSFQTEFPAIILP